MLLHFGHEGALVLGGRFFGALVALEGRFIDRYRHYYNMHILFLEFSVSIM